MRKMNFTMHKMNLTLCTEENYNFVQDMKIGEKVTFDIMIRERWEEAKKKGIFRYMLNIQGSKILDGKYQFLAQLNVDRRNRRSPENIMSMKQPFDEKRFNFLKLVPEEEIITLNSKDEEDIIAINASPIEYGHSLLLPQRCKKLPQVVTKYSLYKAIELFSLSSSPYLRVGFNSLCANASVNHLHWHLYYLNQRMLLEHIHLGEYAGPIKMLEEYPAKGFCIKYSNVPNIDDFVNWAYLVINYLQNAQIAHNVYITRAKLNSEDEYKDLRMYIWARTSTIGAKFSDAFNVALCELFGHLTIKSEETYNNITEKYVEQVLREVTEEAFSSVAAEIKDLIARELSIAKV